VPLAWYSLAVQVSGHICAWQPQWPGCSLHLHAARGSAGSEACLGLAGEQHCHGFWCGVVVANGYPVKLAARHTEQEARRDLEQPTLLRISVLEGSGCSDHVCCPSVA
jgi:hypothetical protein